MMRRRLPTVAALNAFDAAARHSSITRAAEELCLTEGAVSRQISLLEEQLGVRLFNRIKKRISLTRAGVMYSSRVRQLIDRMERDTLAVMAYEGAGAVLNVAALPTVGSNWLVPRLGDFYRRYPAMTIHVNARNSRFFFNETALDCALYFGEPDWPGAHTDYLFDEILVPVGSPSFLNGQPFLEPDELVKHRLLHLESRPQAWGQWCHDAGLDESNTMRGAHYDIQAMIINAACAGQGVALLPQFLIAEPVKAGQLAILNPLFVRSQGAYYLAYPFEQADQESLTAFREWLSEQSASFRERKGENTDEKDGAEVLSGLMYL